jgi:hypothetical protein
MLALIISCAIAGSSRRVLAGRRKDAFRVPGRECCRYSQRRHRGSISTVTSKHALMIRPSPPYNSMASALMLRRCVLSWLWLPSAVPTGLTHKPNLAAASD